MADPDGTAGDLGLVALGIELASVAAPLEHLGDSRVYLGGFCRVNRIAERHKSAANHFAEIVEQRDAALHRGILENLPRLDVRALRNLALVVHEPGVSHCVGHAVRKLRISNLRQERRIEVLLDVRAL